MSIDVILNELKAVEILICDEDLETHILENRQTGNLLPNLKLLNGVPIEITKPEEREKEKEVVGLMSRLFQLSNCYAIQQGATQQAIWYLMDEVASVVQHSDKPNIKVKTFFHSPTNKANDPDQLPISVMWPVQDI